MPQVKPPRPKVGPPPKELRNLAEFLAKRGYTLAIPFDDIRLPGYIGGFNDKGQEIIIDDGKCLKDLTTTKSGSTVLGNFKQASKFSIKSFLGLFGGLLGLDFEFLRAKNVSIRFPQIFAETKYIADMDIKEDWDKLSPACKRTLTDPSNFLIVQALITDSIAYDFDLKKKLDAKAKADLEKIIKTQVVGDIKVDISFESETSFSIEMKGKPMSVGYKTASMTFKPITPAEMVALRKRPTG